MLLSIGELAGSIVDFALNRFSRSFRFRLAPTL
jgi:hypothetical protein